MFENRVERLVTTIAQLVIYSSSISLFARCLAAAFQKP